MTGRASIRRARMADIPVIVDIEAESFPDPWGGTTFMEILEYSPTTFFVADTGKNIAGFIAGGLEDTGEEIYGHICNLAVTGSWRRSGIGRDLVRRLENQFLVEGASGVQLEVRLSNLPAQKFYRTIGYREVFQIAQYYANGEDAVVMMKWFSI
jgi:ribosomal-protein-alanine N-acetyltransferase